MGTENMNFSCIAFNMPRPIDCCHSKNGIKIIINKVFYFIFRSDGGEDDGHFSDTSTTSTIKVGEGKG